MMQAKEAMLFKMLSQVYGTCLYSYKWTLLRTHFM